MSSLHDEIADIKSSFDGNMDDCEDAKLELNFSYCIIKTAFHVGFRQTTSNNPSLNLPTAQESPGSLCIRAQDRGRVFASAYPLGMGFWCISSSRP